MILATVYELLSLMGNSNVNFEKLSIITSKCRFPLLEVVNSRAKSILIV